VQIHEIEQGLSETVSLLDKLRMAIYRGEFPPGQRLVESELAEKYNTSRGAVREALALLQNEHLVTRQRNRSAWVRAVTIEEAIEILEVRGLIEGLCAARAATRAADEDRRELRRLADEMTDAVKNGDVLTDSMLSDQIHTRLREIAGQQTAAGIIDRLRHQGVRYQFHVSLLPGRPGREGAPGHHRRGDLRRPGGGRADHPRALRQRRRLPASARGCGHAVDPAGGLGRSENSR
jgi:DNA-binding GntR family transcriptional regulator